ncbi:MAG TPA: hypothetical protein VGD59_13635 [Acidisarcina sp.]
MTKLTSEAEDSPLASSGTETLPVELTSSEVPAQASAPGRFDGLLSFLSRRLGLDRAIVFTLLGRGWSSLAGLSTLILIAHFLTPAEQGYYYTFNSLVMLQLVFELGFSFVIMQNASHEVAHLTLASDGAITGPERSHGRLASVLQRSIRWYSLAAVLMGSVLMPLGIVFFRYRARPGSGSVHWLLPWCLVVIASSCMFQIDPNFSFLEGCGYVSNVARMRLAQAVFGALLGWSAMLLHHGLFAPACIIFGQAIVGLAFLFSRRGLLLGLLRHSPGANRIDWRAEVWPFQWRLAISWVCGYFIFQLFTPFTFYFRGPVQAGQMGSSLSISGVLFAIAIAWMNTKAAPMGRMIARREFALLDRTFFPALGQSTLAALLGCTAAWFAIYYLRVFRVPFALRLLPPLPLALLFVGTVLQIIINGYALYLRAHKQEKFLMNSILGAVWTTLSTVVLGRLYGAMGIVAGYLLGVILIGMGFGTHVFLKYRRLWHAN